MHNCVCEIQTHSVNLKSITIYKEKSFFTAVNTFTTKMPSSLENI